MRIIAIIIIMNISIIIITSTVNIATESTTILHIVTISKSTAISTIIIYFQEKL